MFTFVDSTCGVLNDKSLEFFSCLRFHNKLLGEREVLRGDAKLVKNGKNSE